MMMVAEWMAGWVDKRQQQRKRQCVNAVVIIIVLVNKTLKMVMVVPNIKITYFTCCIFKENLKQKQKKTTVPHTHTISHTLRRTLKT